MPPVTIWGQTLAGVPSAATADATNYTLGCQFSVTALVPLTAVWFHSPPGVAAAVLPNSIGVWQVTSASAGTLLASRTSVPWSGAGGTRWVRAAFTTPVTLTPGVQYVAGVARTGGTTNWYSSVNNFFSGSGPGAAGLTSPPLVMPNNAGAFGGQMRYIVTSTLSLPNQSFNASTYWIDPEVEVAAAGPPVKAWDGTAWAGGRLRGWDGAAWRPVRAWDGQQWRSLAG